MGEIEETHREYLKNLCRICLQTTDGGTYLFSADAVSKEILDKIHLCFQIILTCEKYLPRFICNSCSKELEYADSFRLKCLTFEERFTSLKEFANKDNSVDVTENFNSDNLIQTENVNEYEENSIIGQKQKGISQNKSFQCEICNKILKSKVLFLKHNISMHQKRKHIGRMSGTGLNRQYHCTRCPYSTPHSQTLVNHMRKHNGEKPYHCDCGKSFTQSASLAAHQKIHTNLMMYTCSTCGKQFKHAFSLKNHQRVHEDAKFSCNLCAKTLKSQQSLKAHMNRHYNVRNYNCEDCGDTFVTSADLLNHRKRHDQELKAECHLCGYKTHAKKNLAIHLKRHAGDKAYKCNICNKAEYTLSDLRRHQRVHSRERPYPCPACSQKFSHSGSLNQHVRSIHGLAYRWSESKITQTKTSVKLEKE